MLIGTRPFFYYHGTDIRVNGNASDTAGFRQNRLNTRRLDVGWLFFGMNTTTSVVLQQCPHKDFTEDAGHMRSNHVTRVKIKIQMANYKGCTDL